MSALFPSKPVMREIYHPHLSPQMAFIQFAGGDDQVLRGKSVVHNIGVFAI